MLYFASQLTGIIRGGDTRLRNNLDLIVFILVIYIAFNVLVFPTGFMIVINIPNEHLFNMLTNFLCEKMQLSITSAQLLLCFVVCATYLTEGTVWMVYG